MTAEPPRDPVPPIGQGAFFTPPKAVAPGARLRTYFLTGVVVFGPVAVTLYIVWWFVSLVDNWVRPLVPARFWPDTYLPVHIPGFGLVIAIFGLTMLGFLTANLVGRTFLNLGEWLLARMPIVRGIYKSLKQIFTTVFSNTGQTFRKVGLIQIYGKGIWTMVFLSAEPRGAIADGLPDGHHTSVFLPCTPNPTSGFFLYVPTSEIVVLSITPDEAFKVILSVGVVQPDDKGVVPDLHPPGRGRQEPVHAPLHEPLHEPSPGADQPDRLVALEQVEQHP